MRQVVVLGSGGHAKVVIDILRGLGTYDVVGCLMDDTDPTRTVCGVPIVGPSDGIEGLDRRRTSVAIGLGGWTDNREREQLFERAAGLELDIVTAIHPRAHVAPSAEIGRGSTIFPGAIIGAEAVIGQNVIIATNASVDHESEVRDHCLVSAGVTIGAHVTVDRGALVAIGATVASRVTVGRGSLVAAGAVVVDDVAVGASVRGVPARPL